ncbi:MAG: hypothetical protein ACYC1C_18240 [Chloroflexota bacterium]
MENVERRAENMGQRAQGMEGGLLGTLENISGRTYFWLAITSISISALLFLSGRRNLSMFVGQWPPTFVALALFFRLLHPSQEPGSVESMRHAAEETRRQTSEHM